MIKRIIFYALLLISITCYSQSASFSKLKNKIHEKYPEVVLEDKLIAVNYWRVNDEKSRRCNTEFDRTAKVYRNALLKGGSEGLVVMSVSGDDLNPEATIVLTKDGITQILSFSAAELGNIIPGNWSNVVFDSFGREIYRDMEDAKIYSSIQKLITR